MHNRGTFNIMRKFRSLAVTALVAGDGQRTGGDSTTYLNVHDQSRAYLLGNRSRFGSFERNHRPFSRGRGYWKSVTGSTHFFAGTTKANSSPYYDDGIMANNTFTFFEVPSGYTVFAPTMRPAGTDCLEIGAQYSTGTPLWYVFDLCQGTSGNFVVQKPLTSAFQSAYLRDLTGDGHLMYTAESILNPTAQDWQAWLYNYTTSTWELIAEFGGTYPSGWASENAWDMFEEYAPSTTSPCADIQPAESQGIQMYHYSPGNSGWVSALPQYNVTQWDLPSGNNCWNTDMGYVLTWPREFAHWIETQPG